MSQYEEIRFVRRVYSGLTSLLDQQLELNPSTIKDLTNITHNCMLQAYENLFEPNLSELIKNQSKQNVILSTYLHTVFSCWSGAALYNNPGKSSDLAGKCPFHWNHLSCADWKEKNSPSWKNKIRYLFYSISLLFLYYYFIVLLCLF